jgi:hypothetical protein
MTRLSVLPSLTVFALAACHDSTGPAGPASEISAKTNVAATATVGATVRVSMRVVDARGTPVSNGRVKFVTTAGDGSVSPEMVLTNADGVAQADWTVGHTAGPNTLVASMELVADSEKVTVTGTADQTVGVRVVPRVLRFPQGTMSLPISASTVDQYGNKTSGAVSLIARSGFVTISNGNASPAAGPGTGYVVASSGTLSDSAYVIVLGSNDPPCTGLTSKATLAVGEVMTTGFNDNGVCLAATTTGGEYAFVPYFDSSVPSANTTLTLTAYGISAPGSLADIRLAGHGTIASPSRADLNRVAFEDRLASLAEGELAPRVSSARAWYAQRVAVRKSAMLDAVVPKVGDRMTLNTNSLDYCVNAQMRTGRVVAVTQHAVVLADTANPANGFSDAEYAAYGAAFDTVSYLVDVANFGEPTDIDNNGGRVILFFTHAVNENGAGVLGFFFGRDLLPKVGEFGSCPGSNVGEIVNLFVPDNVTPKSYVTTKIVGTLSHEFQHLINAARRLYINKSAAISEERWLNEGLSHIAEELTFYRASGLTPRQNIGSAALASGSPATAFSLYGTDNISRLREYIRSPDTQSPIGVDDNDDDFGTRGAIWSYLRYVADQRFSQTESTLWAKLVNSNSAGLQNLYDVVGSDARAMMHDWTLAILLDDFATGVAAKYQMPSWNYRQVASPYGLTLKWSPLTNNATTTVTLQAGGTSFARFATSANVDAYVTAGGISGTGLPPHVLLALVRTK